ncbi:hypothetical protein LCGC14_1220170 [marine sediment metagenome]|uniref:Uncharacterized protein n=1 Tax=marine sediment metagenome TaxID=412755 RepID=A0A0F9LBJ6_9ZZZZ
MKKINIKQGPDQLTVMLVGGSRAGKTYAAGTFPRPIFMSDASEHGWTTLGSIKPNDLYEEKRQPTAVGIETPVDMIAALKALQEQAAGNKVGLAEWPLAQGKWECGTVVIDSLTFYADAYFSALEATSDNKNDKRAMYGELASHLRYIMIQFHRLPYHIIWTALSSINDDSRLRGALIPGSTAAKAPARCDIWLYLEPFTEKAKGGDKDSRENDVIYEAHTQNYAGNKAGHRFGDRFPAIIEPNFQVIEECLGMTPWTDRLKAKKSSGRKTAAKDTTNNRATAPQ